MRKPVSAPVPMKAPSCALMRQPQAQMHAAVTMLEGRPTGRQQDNCLPSTRGSGFGPLRDVGPHEKGNVIGEWANEDLQRVVKEDHCDIEVGGREILGEGGGVEMRGDGRVEGNQQCREDEWDATGSSASEGGFRDRQDDEIATEKDSRAAEVDSSERRGREKRTRTRSEVERARRGRIK